MMTSINPEKFLPKLLELLSKAKAVAGTEGEAVLRFENIKEQLDEVINDGLLPKVKLLDQTLLRQFTSLERRLGKIIVGAETTYSTVEAINEALDFMDKDVKQIKLSMPLGKLMPAPEPIPEPQVKWIPVVQLDPAKKMSEEWSQLGLQDRFHDSSAMINMRRTYENLESLELKLCLLSFSVFPEGAEIKKRPLIYWWIGEGFIRSTQQKTAEEVGEEVFQNLVMRKGLNIQPYLKASSSSAILVNSCTIHPWIRRMLISLASEAKLFHFDASWSRMPSYDTLTCRHACLVFDNPIPQGNDGPKVDNLLTLFNVSVQYLDMKKEWLNKLKKVRVLQLGRWQRSAGYHIEVEDETSLKGLGTQKHLKYLSLRGISRVSQLSPSILNLVSLQILDLRACHNLETIPSDISSLRNLTHLDLSECYLLEGMPKGIEKLSSLQVLKGFLIGSSQKTPCRLGDLAKLKNLKRLSIHMGNEAVVEEGEFKKLKEMLSLRRLKVSWGVVSPLLKGKIMKESLEFSFPPYLEKLDLQGIPMERVQWLNPSQLKNLKKLYIRGGELVSLGHGETDGWMVENLRLKYLGKLDIDLPRLKALFSHLQHLEKIKCHEIEKDVYDEDIVF
ncbi:disease resistance RPP13-like protein 4 [Rosa sericea]